VLGRGRGRRRDVTSGLFQALVSVSGGSDLGVLSWRRFPRGGRPWCGDLGGAVL